MNVDPRFFDFLKERIGLDVASVGPAIIERAVRLRCHLTHSAHLENYWLLLKSDSQEQQALIEAVIVPETWFFRYAESFSTLSRLALGRVGRTERPLRILSLPCSTGEEPYSIAMALFDAAISPSLFSVDAVDISPLSIAKARRGVYGKNSFRGERVDFRDRYFTAQAEGYELASKVQAQVRFQSGNLLDPQLLADQAPYDFVFCRNLLIYFDLPTQKLVFEILKRLTRQDGVLFIGPAEGNLLTRMGMRSLGVAQSFAFSHEDAAGRPVAGNNRIALVALPEPQPKPASFAPKTPYSPRIPSPQSALASALRKVSPPKPAPLGSADSHAAQALTKIAGLANEGRSAQARAASEAYLQQYGPNAEAFYWLGLLADTGGDRIAAQNFYRKVLYLQPQHSEALAQLAALLTAQGDLAGARRLQERATRGANKNHSERDR